jgi:hypothetical protein
VLPGADRRGVAKKILCAASFPQAAHRKCRTQLAELLLQGKNRGDENFYLK